jgi:predicted RNase H-like HicB family nuclease
LSELVALIPASARTVALPEYLQAGTGSDALASTRVYAEGNTMKNYTAVVERDTVTGLLVGYVPGFPGAHTQAESLDELQKNLREVIEMLLEDGEPKLEAEFVGTQSIAVS